MAKTSVDIDMETLDKVRGILGTESIGETISSAFSEVIRMAAVRDRAVTEHQAAAHAASGS